MVTAYPGMESEVSFTRDHLEFSTSARRGRIPAGWLLSEHSHQWCSWLRQVAPASRTQRVKIATSPLCMALIHSPTIELYLYRKLGLSKPHTQSGRAADHLIRQPGTAPLDSTIENSHPVYRNGMGLLSWMTWLQVYCAYSWLEWLQQPGYLASCLN